MRLHHRTNLAEMNKVCPGPWVNEWVILKITGWGVGYGHVHYSPLSMLVADAVSQWSPMTNAGYDTVTKFNRAPDPAFRFAQPHRNVPSLLKFKSRLDSGSNLLALHGLVLASLHHRTHSFNACNQSPSHSPTYLLLTLRDSSHLPRCKNPPCYTPDY